MQITDVRTYLAPETGTSWINNTRIANPMTPYAQFSERRSSWRGPSGRSVYIEVATDKGVTGLGETRGGEVTQAIVEGHLKTLLVGSDPRNIEILWEQMFRATLPYGRKGVPILAISGVDLALWDLLAKLLDQPLYRLLGGATKTALPVYATHPDPATLVREGYVGMKVPMAFGPTDGKGGLQANLERVATAREAVGPDIDLMVDCYMAWDVEYTLAFAREAESYNIRWIEESLPPDDYDGYAELRRRLNWTRIATGEHEYTRWGFRELLDRGCADVLQPDVAWAGGITEVRRIAAMASAFNLPVIPHAGGVQPWTIHWMYATTNCPMAESIVFYSTSDQAPPPILRTDYQFQDGQLRPSERPGAGVEIDWSELERQSAGG